MITLMTWIVTNYWYVALSVIVILYLLYVTRDNTKLMSGNKADGSYIKHNSKEFRQNGHRLHLGK